MVRRQKHAVARRGQPFKASGSLRVAAFGDSRIMGGFVPRQFDMEAVLPDGRPVESFNFGVAGDTRFLDELEALIAHGMTPDIILVGDASWPAEKPAWTFLEPSDDQHLVNVLFPFRNLPRDVILAIAKAGASPTRMRAMYEERAMHLREVAADAGVFRVPCPRCTRRAIHGARRDAAGTDAVPHALPPDFQAPGDSPRSDYVRPAPRGPTFVRLDSILIANDIILLFIPSFFRVGEFAPPPPGPDSAFTALLNVHEVAIGSPYVLLDPTLFFDEHHLNAKGGAVYTTIVAQLFSAWTKAQPPSRRARR